MGRLSKPPAHILQKMLPDFVEKERNLLPGDDDAYSTVGNSTVFRREALPACFLSRLMYLVATNDTDLILNQNKFVLFCQRDNELSRTATYTPVKCINI